MKKFNTPSLFVAAAITLTVGAAGASPLLLDTGTPNGAAVGGYTFDSNDSYAGLVNFASASQVQSIAAHVLNGAAGETFTIALFSNSASQLPDQQLYAATATFSADGWNGVSGLSGWNVTAGSYWVALEVGASDTLGTNSVGPVLDTGAPTPVAATAFNGGSGYQSTAVPMSIGLQVDAVSAVPEPGSLALLSIGLMALFAGANRVKRR
ncbi:PEP-CTERM sorting domain-containing protein [Roseateles koreensis]|uniref:PEP-CTERM sorting domain-containing protein n=1 Tax=Roseateles koreensis TaxID=2987526 RepID=A0ABT5KUY0_9BURK|nr:PEP-CTERM sorting domain-containing protein [Roseateles koreensis]MDC8786245.1 PEP-CTERM sorting domain-containing protein [Roseateles koreensis]